MHDLQALTKDCMAILSRLGIPCAQVSRVEVDKRARRTWGTCRRLLDGSYRIGISPILLQDNTPEQSLIQTLYHELLHAATGMTGHTGRWKEYANVLNRVLGTNIRRTASWQDMQLEEERDAHARYRFRCRGCGQILTRYRLCPFVRHPQRYRCSSCGGSFVQLP